MPFALTFNTKYMDKAEAQAKGWQILLDPKLKGKVAIPKFGWQGEAWMNGVNLALGGSYDNFDPVMAFCRKILAGHVASVYIAHLVALRVFATHRQAWLSELPLLLLMMCYTFIGLAVLSLRSHCTKPKLRRPRRAHAAHQHEQS